MSTMEPGEEDSHGYFVPMIDMLAGVIFILIIMLAAVSLVSRDDFTKASAAQAEITRINAELQQARQQEATYIEPRRIAEAALRLLLQRLQKDLAAAGITAQALPNDGRLVIADPGLFAPGIGLTPHGQSVAAVLATALQGELPCLARGAVATGNCADYRQAHLDEATVLVTGAASDGRDGHGEARALAGLSAIAADRPGLLLHQAVDGRKLLDYRAAQTLPEHAVATVAPTPSTVPPNPANGSPPAAGAPPPPSPAASLPANALELVFKMNVPPLPPK